MMVGTANSSMRVSVIGGGSVTEQEAKLARAVGERLGRRDHTVVCGGLGGTMRAVCRGAKATGGETIGILPVEDRSAANEYVDIAIATGMGHARNALVPLNGDGVIALPGRAGTLSEIGFAGVYDRPIVGIGCGNLPGVETVETPEAAVASLEARVER